MILRFSFVIHDMLQVIFCLTWILVYNYMVWYSKLFYLKEWLEIGQHQFSWSHRAKLYPEMLVPQATSLCIEVIKENDVLFKIWLHVIIHSDEVCSLSVTSVFSVVKSVSYCLMQEAHQGDPALRLGWHIVVRIIFSFYYMTLFDQRSSYPCKSVLSVVKEKTIASLETKR